jgi:hypothetical protein
MMTAEFIEVLLIDEKASIGKLLNALSWLNKDITQLRNRQKWIDKNASPQTIEFISNQILAEIKKTERLIKLIELKLKNKCTS